MDEYKSIFVESTEDIGVLYNSYRPVIDRVQGFMDMISDYITRMLKDPTRETFNINDQIEEFKRDVDVEFTPEPIDPNNMRGMFRAVKDCNSILEEMLSKYVKLKDNIAYGGNYLRAIIKKPKVYARDTDPETYDRINNNIRVVNRAMDWVEKVLIDLFNLNDQDMNILHIVNRVYVKKHIYESFPDAHFEDDEPMDYYFEKASHRKTEEWRGECNSFWKMFKVDLDRLGDIKSPDKEIKIKIGNKNMTFKTSIGNKPGKKEKLSKYAQVPTSIHNYNVNKDIICTDKIGIGRALVHYCKLRDHSFNSKLSIDDVISRYNIKPKKLIFQLYGNIALTFSSSLDERGIGITINNDLRCRDGDTSIIYMEAGNNYDKPKSDHPIRDTFQDIDRASGKINQEIKKGVQDAQNVGRAMAKPVKRATNWMHNMSVDYHDKKETEIKERLADPHVRSKLYKGIKDAFLVGALAKAGLLLNPLFLFIAVTSKAKANTREFRIRNEMIGELKANMGIIKEKINDIDAGRIKGATTKDKYQLMRQYNEIEKKLIRVGGTKEMSKIL